MAGVLFSGGRRLSDAKEPLAGVVISGIGVSSVAFNLGVNFLNLRLCRRLLDL